MTRRPTSDQAAEVVTAQQAWSQAIVTNDANVIADRMTSDWVIVTPDGVVVADQFLAAIRSSALRHTRMEAAPEQDGVPRVRVYGDVAVLTHRFVSTEIREGQTRDNDEWMTTVFVRSQGRWLTTLIHLTPA
jgi:ketosteroid isomerase-like protein